MMVLKVMAVAVYGERRVRTCSKLTTLMLSVLSVGAERFRHDLDTFQAL